MVSSYSKEFRVTYDSAADDIIIVHRSERSKCVFAPSEIVTTNVYKNKYSICH